MVLMMGDNTSTVTSDWVGGHGACPVIDQRKT